MEDRGAESRRHEWNTSSSLWIFVAFLCFWWVFFPLLCFCFSPSPTPLLYYFPPGSGCRVSVKKSSNQELTTRRAAHGNRTGPFSAFIRCSPPNAREETSTSEVKGRGRRAVCSRFTSYQPQCSYFCSALREDSHHGILLSLFSIQLMGLIRNKPTESKRKVEVKCF